MRTTKIENLVVIILVNLILLLSHMYVASVLIPLFLLARGVKVFVGMNIFGSILSQQIW